MGEPLHALGNLCQLCSGINVEVLSRPGGYEYHATVEAWLKSAHTCRLCNVLLATTLEGPVVMYDNINDLVKDETFVNSHGIALRLRERNMLTNLKNYVYINLTLRSNPTQEPKHLSGIYVFTNQNDPAATSQVPWKRDLPDSTGSEASFKVAESWLKTCLREHSDDKPDRALSPNTQCSYTAARLVELSPTSVRVVQGKSVKEPYATLSYCWGPGDQWPWGPERLAKDRLGNELKKGLSRDALPKTIREAVLVAERLNLRYIWVDVLCILQTELHRSDWLHELRNMATIYAEAQVNIAASSSRDKESGLFSEHSSSLRHPYGGCIQVDSTVHGQPSTLYFRPNRQRDLYTGSAAFHNQVEQGELASRGWVCQERIASPRILYYGETQLYWQCNHVHATEDNLGEGSSETEDQKPWRSLYHAETDPHAVHGSKDDGYLDMEDLRGHWYSFIVPKYYSSRKLTNQCDKLVAISGLAKKLQSHRPTIRYLAGLWEGIVLEGLLWCAKGPGRTFDKEKGYVAPTWSWASRDGGVEYNGHFGAAFAQFDCELLHCQVENEEAEQFGPVLSATLEIEAAFLCGCAKALNPETYSEANPNLFLGDGTIAGLAMLDDDRHDDLSVYAVLLRRDTVNTVFLLITLSSAKSGEYIRVGIGSVRSYRYPDSLQNLPRSRWLIV